MLLIRTFSFELITLWFFMHDFRLAISVDWFCLHVPPCVIMFAIFWIDTSCIGGFELHFWFTVDLWAGEILIDRVGHLLTVNSTFFLCFLHLSFGRLVRRVGRFCLGGVPGVAHGIWRGPGSRVAGMDDVGRGHVSFSLEGCKPRPDYSVGISSSLSFFVVFCPVKELICFCLNWWASRSLYLRSSLFQTKSLEVFLNGESVCLQFSKRWALTVFRMWRSFFCCRGWKHYPGNDQGYCFPLIAWEVPILEIVWLDWLEAKNPRTLGRLWRGGRCFKDDAYMETTFCMKEH